MKVKKTTGILGGTFNPIHKGHIELGNRALEFYRLDRVLYILSAIPPHKQNQSVVSAELRWEMLEMALKPFNALEPSDIELKRKNYSYTIDTITQLKKIFPKEKFFFISGSEGFLKIRTWKDYKKLLKTLDFIVLVREPEQKEKVETLLDEESIPCTEDRNLDPEGPKVHIFSYNSTKLNLSSTLIRKKIKNRESIDNLVTNDVKNFITEHKLYE